MTWMAGSFESVWWNTCAHRLDLGLSFHPKEFKGMESTQGKNPLFQRLRGGPHRECYNTHDSEPNTPPTELFRPPVVMIFFFFCVPQLGFTTFGWDFCVCDRFFNPTIKVVTFRLHGWCVLGVFSLPAFTRLGHERQDLLSLCDEMHVWPRFILSSEGVLGE